MFQSPGINASVLMFPRLRKATPSNQCNALAAGSAVPAEWKLQTFSCISLLGVAASFQCQTICSLWKGRWAPQAVSSGQLWLNGRRHSSSSRSAAFLHPNTRAAAACWCSRQGGQEEAQAAPGEQRGTAQKTPLLPSTRFVPPVLPVSGDSGGLSFFPWRDHAAVMGGQGQGHRHTVCLDAQMGANKARRR